MSTSNCDGTDRPHFWSLFLNNSRDFNLPLAADNTSTPNVNADSPRGVIAASASADFATPSRTRPNSIISDSSISAGCYTSNTASTTTPQHLITCDNNGGGIARVSGWLRKPPPKLSSTPQLPTILQRGWLRLFWVDMIVFILYILLLKNITLRVHVCVIPLTA